MVLTCKLVFFMRANKYQLFWERNMEKFNWTTSLTTSVNETIEVQLTSLINKWEPYYSWNWKVHMDALVYCSLWKHIQNQGGEEGVVLHSTIKCTEKKNPLITFYQSKIYFQRILCSTGNLTAFFPSLTQNPNYCGIQGKGEGATKLSPFTACTVNW